MFIYKLSPLSLPLSSQSVASSKLHTCRNSNQPHLLLKLPSSPSVHSLRQKYPNFSSQPPYNMPSWSNPSHLLQVISPSLLPALTHIINTSLLTGTFSNAFKQAWVTPLLKKPTLNTSLTDSYRPVSLLPFIAKTLEWVVFNQLSSFLLKCNLLDANQSGFRCEHSTETALLLVTEALRIAKADSKSSVLILLDLSAAFDTVNHQIFLTTLSSLGITGITLHWFESYLTGRSFKVAWGGEVSTEHQLVTGVPQGSVLAPLLISTYTTSLGPIIQAHGISYHCYDDTQLYISFRPDDPKVAARISGCLADISAWMKEHHLQLNLATLLAGLPSCTIKPLQMIQNAAARLVFSEPKRAHVTPLFISLHWLPVAACIKFKTLMLAYRTATGSAPTYFHSLLRIYIPSRSLRSASEHHLVVPSQRGTKSLSRTFSFTVPGWWNELSNAIRNDESLTIFKRHLKTHLFRHHLTSSLKKTPSLFPYLCSLSLNLSLSG